MSYVYSIPQEYFQAGDPATNPEVLDDLSTSPDYRIRMRIAENLASCTSTLYRLLFDEHPEVRLALASNRKIPRFFYDYLVSDSNSDIRLALAEDKRLSLRLLKELSKDENPYVAERAKKSICQKNNPFCSVNFYREAG